MKSHLLRKSHCTKNCQRIRIKYCNSRSKWAKLLVKFITSTHGCKSLTTLLVKYYNDLLDRQSSGQDRDEVTNLYVGDVFCISLDTIYPDFQENIFVEISEKTPKLFIVVMLLQ